MPEIIREQPTELTDAEVEAVSGGQATGGNGGAGGTGGNGGTFSFQNAFAGSGNGGAGGAGGNGGAGGD